MEKNILRKIYFALISLMALIGNATGLGVNKKTWTYELKEITATSSDPEKVKIDLEIERVSRGVFAISGNVLINIDIVEGDSNQVHATSFRSIRGDGDYKILPFQMPKGHVFKILNTYYKDILMTTLKECSDLPVFEEKFEPPLEKKSYKLEACQFSQDGFPNHMQEGFYKVSIFGSGEVEYKIDVIAEVIPDL